MRGRLEEVTEAEALAALHRSRLRPWAPAPRDHWMAVDPSLVTGRMIQRHRHLRPGNHLPYMEAG